MDEPRDYRDPADVDETLSLLRIATVEQAQRLFQLCLDNAYAQGRKEGVHEAIQLAVLQIEQEIRKHLPGSEDRE